MKQDTKLIRVDLDFKNAFNSAGHSSLWKILEGFGVPDVSLPSSIYEHSTIRIQVGNKSSATIQLDTGTVQGSALSPLLFDLFINALLRLLDSTGISHRVRGIPDWNHQAFADNLSLYVGATEDANTLLDIVSEFQEWSGLKISIKKSLATGALHGRGETQRQKDTSAESRKRKAPVLLQHTSKAVLQKTQDLENLPCDSADDTHLDDEDVVTACDKLTSRSLLQRCDFFWRVLLEGLAVWNACVHDVTIFAFVCTFLMEIFQHEGFLISGIILQQLIDLPYIYIKHFKM